ncbi:MAG TPA: hypothetical protein VLV83_13925 [Acidobacteriota bacterium]|nr:hypothetical protein [Acidobacteriota bacterium]
MVDLDKYRTIFRYRTSAAYSLRLLAYIVVTTWAMIYFYNAGWVAYVFPTAIGLAILWQRWTHHYLTVFPSVIQIDEGDEWKSIKVKDLAGWQKVDRRIALQRKKKGIYWIELDSLSDTDQTKLMSKLSEMGIPHGSFDASLLSGQDPTRTSRIWANVYSALMLAASLLLAYFF